MPIKISREDVVDYARGMKERMIALTHNNEKHLDDFSSDDSSLIDDGASAAVSTPGKHMNLGFPSKKAAPDTIDPKILGADPIVKTYYEGHKSRDDFYDWVEAPPRQMSKKQALKADRVAIKLYKIKDVDKSCVNGRFQLKNFMLEIQNPILISALAPILRKENIHLDPNEVANFHHPFRALYFRADEIVEMHRSAPEGEVLKQQALLLIKVMSEVFGSTRAHVQMLQASKPVGLITYQHAWAYFPKGALAYRPGKDVERIFKIVDAKYEKEPKPHLSVKAKEIQFDGTTFNWSEMEIPILPWEGNKPITEVSIFPLHFHKDAEDIRARMMDRGRKVLDFQGLAYSTYTGVGLHEGEKCMEKHNVDGRILVDMYGYAKHFSALNRQSGRDSQTNRNKIVPITGRAKARARKTWEVTAGPDMDARASSYIKRISLAEQEINKQMMLEREEDLVYLSPMVKGYDLKSKIWLQFYVEDVRPVDWNDEAYEHLVYPEEQKDLVLSFVENHQTSRIAGIEMDDVIKGKGQGLILLLSGPPGSGKTLTAEAVADKTRRPLYYLQAEDLGVNAASLGANLKKVFELATEWDAVILLDEADVFMAERNPQDIARNELVSIFLRELEYFRGILFLTTNLAQSLDSAFRSRVNIHLLFSPLAPAARLVLWRKFLERLPPLKVQQPKTEGEYADEVQKSTRTLDYLSDEDLKELSQWDLNGREIKNAIKTVKSWCDAKGYEMSLSRLESGIKVTAPHASKRGEVDTSLFDD